jgi:hypothetical protein
VTDRKSDVSVVPSDDGHKTITWNKVRHSLLAIWALFLRLDVTARPVEAIFMQNQKTTYKTFFNQAMTEGDVGGDDRIGASRPDLSRFSGETTSR